jgi:hypothetical protein
MSNLKIILIGADGHAHACIDVIEQYGQNQIAGEQPSRLLPTSR